MKKLFCTILALALMLSLGTVSVFAEAGASSNAGLGSSNIDVQAIYSNTATPSTTYSVNLAWGAMEFTYMVAGSNVWNPSTHTYTSSTTGSWSASGNRITVTNHSNASVKAAFSFTAKTGFTGLTPSFTSATLTLPTAYEKATDAPELTGTTDLTISGTLADTVTSKTSIGTITVTLSAS